MPVCVYLVNAPVFGQFLSVPGVHMTQWMGPLEQLGVNCPTPPLSAAAGGKRLHSLLLISSGISAGTVPTASHSYSFLFSYYISTRIHCGPHHPVLFSFWEPIHPWLCWQMFSGTVLLGNKSAGIPYLNGTLHSITGRLNCNRKAIVAYLSSCRERRLFALWLLHEWCWVMNRSKWQTAKSE